MSESQIAALLHEMERHVLAGRDERVSQIKAELAALGHKVEDAGSEVRTTSVKRPKS